MALLDRDGVNLYYEVHGAGPAILLTHGYSATSSMWATQIEALSEHHTLILWDIRGHGQSDSPADSAAWSERITTADMAALLDHLGFEQAIVGGLSLGGYYSLAFQRDYAHRVRALLVFDTGPGFRNDAARAGWNVHANEMADAFEQQGAAALAGGSMERSDSVHRDIGGLVKAGRFLLTQQDGSVMESLAGIDVPTLVVVGEDDAPFRAAADYMSNKIPDARLHVIAGAGHAVNIDQSQAFNEVVREFLRDHAL